jgi:hypothetical protein
MKPLRLAALAAALLLAGCTASPTHTATDARPSFDGGASMGSGNRDGSSTGATTQSDTTQRGGNTLGGGH